MNKELSMMDTEKRAKCKAIPDNVKDAVQLAVTVITEQLQSGLWWSGKRSSDQETDIHTTNSSTTEYGGETALNYGEKTSSGDGTISSSCQFQEFPQQNVGMFLQALGHFASDVIIPSFTSQGIDLQKQGRRAFLASCMMLREILITNADGIFYPKAPLNLGKETTTTDDREVQLFQDSVIVTALILSAIQSIDDGPSDIMDESNDAMQVDREGTSPTRADSSNSMSSTCDEFAQLVSDYHNRCGSFSPRSPFGFDHHPHAQERRFLPRLDCRTTGVYPNGEKMSKEESKAWRISYNLVRDQHFFAANNRYHQSLSGSGDHNSNIHSTRNLAQQQMRQLIPPEPNMVAAFVVPKPSKIQKEGQLSEEHVALRQSVEKRMAQMEKSSN